MEQETAIRMDEIDIYTILKDLLRNLLLIILSMMIALMGIRTYKNIVYEPEYTANTTLAVMAKGNTDGSVYSSLSTASSMAEVFTEVFQSDILKEKVEEAIGSKIPENTKIVSELIPETNLLVLKVTSEDPQSAYRILQEILKNYRNVSDYIFGNAVLEVMMDPEVPVGPSNVFQTSRLDKLGMLGAAALMTALIVLMSILRSTVKTSKAAKRHLEGECLVTLPFEEKNKTIKSKLQKTNKAVLLSSPVIGFEYEEGCHRLASRLEYKAGKQKKKVILVTSVAENEGKSTVAVNLAMALARRNKKVLLIDMDFAKPALYKLMQCKIEKNQGFVAYLNGECDLNSAVSFDKKNQIYTVLNRQHVEDAQKCLETRRFAMFIAKAKEKFDYIILDSAPVSAGTDTEYQQKYAEASVLVVRKDRVRITDINDTVELLKEGQTEFLGYVLNGFRETHLGSAGRYGYGKYGNYNRVSKTGE